MLTEEQRTEIQQEIDSRIVALLSVPLEKHNAGKGAAQTTSQAQPLEPLVRVIARAVEVLGTSEKALRWLNTPIRSLGDQTPASLLSSPEGITRVEDALGRIEHGVW
jgi:putative toxin-antitoxin system antitoxin component (TIGR02293 family)